MKRMLITGGAGFIGSNAARYFASKGWDIWLLDNLSRRGAEINLDELQHEIPITFRKGDVRRKYDLESIFEAAGGFDAAVHLAAQVAVTTSVTDPVEDFEINARGTLNLLETIRKGSPTTAVLYSSTNKVYGALDSRTVALRNGRYEFTDIDGITENEPLDFHSPYGCSKGAADQYVADYARIYGLRTFVVRQSCIYGTRQFGVEDQGWVAWFARAAMLGRTITIFGDGRQVRDVLWIDDLLDLYDRCLNSNRKNGIYNAGGGVQNSIHLVGIIELLEELLGERISLAFEDWRPGDQRVFISNNQKAFSELGWTTQSSIRDGLAKMVAWIQQNSALVNEVEVAV